MGINWTLELFLRMLSTEKVSNVTIEQGFSKRSWGLLRGPGHKAFTAGPKEESSFWTSIYFWDEIDKIRDGFKVITFFFLSSVDLYDNIITRGPGFWKNLKGCHGPLKFENHCNRVSFLLFIMKVLNWKQWPEIRR